jgi:transcriptional regulator GlxA family with amidase domain
MKMKLSQVNSNHSNPIQAVFVIPPAVHLLDITGPAHIFYEAQCLNSAITLMYCSIFKECVDVVSSAQLSFANLTPFDEVNLKAGDLIFIPGLESSLLFDYDFITATRPFHSWLRKQHQQGVVIASVCTGAFVLAESGLLNSKACTTHWNYIDRFRQRFPSARLETNRLFVYEGNIFTSAGVSSGVDLSLYIIEKLWGGYFAAQIAKMVVVYFRRTINDPQLNVYTQYRNYIDEKIHAIQDHLSQSFHYKLKITDLANQFNMSPRNLTRLFKKTLGTLGDYLAKLRSVRALQLLKNGVTVQSATLQCGLKSPNQLRTLLKRYEEKNIMVSAAKE